MCVSKPLILFLMLTLCSHTLLAQHCNAPGQKPGTAFPVCGITTFNQSNVPLCSNNNIPVPGCHNTQYADKNPFWYRFTCYSSGTLGFQITPNDITDNYDWQLFDITGHHANDVYTDASLVITGNWSGSYGVTGAKAGGSGIIECASDPEDNVSAFSFSPGIVAGHTYLLMVSHYTNSQSGYQLSFDGGTAGITDPAEPNLFTAEANCNGLEIRIKLTKKMQCNTLAMNGSDFILPGTSSQVKSARAVGCHTGFEFDSIILKLDSALLPGVYKLAVKTGTDGNTILDNCDKGIPVGNYISFNVYELQPTPLHHIAPVECAPRQIKIGVDKNIECSTIAKDGSDFEIIGSYPVTIESADGY
jgi:hypothetical protein